LTVVTDRDRSPAEAAPRRRDAPGGVVVHYAPDPDEIGGVAEVVRAYLAADLRPWTVECVSIYTNVSRARQLARLLSGAGALLIRSRRRTQGIHLHTTNGFDLVRTLLLLEIARRRAVPAVITIHGSRFMKEVRRAPWLVRAIVTRARAVTVLSEDVERSVASLGAQRVELLPNPVALRPPPASIGRRRQVLFAGEIGRRKGVDILLNAWEPVRRAHEDATLVLAGPVAEAALIRSLPSGVRYAGPLAHDAVIAALEDSRLAVLPSRAEAMPMFVLEAMAAGVPVVATRVGAVDAILGEAGVVVPAGDSRALATAMVDLLGDTAKLEEMSRNGQRLASANFSTERFAQKVVALYDSAFGA
jgi:glycosyltransferase involved in cell wall biosynthesis